MEKTLALDLGSNSIGWTIRDISFPDEQFRRSGVITFNQGVGEEKNVEYSFAAQRTAKRSIRRLYQARKYKLWQTLESLMISGFCPISIEELNQWRWYKKEEGYIRKYPVNALQFNNWIKLDFNGDGKPDFESPYQLRAELVTRKLDFTLEINKLKVGRALYHIAQHRAFKSSKKVNLKEDINLDSTEVGAERAKHRELEKKLAELGLQFDDSRTVGEVFALAEKVFEEKKEGRIRNNLHTYVIRKDLQKEVEKIFQFQELSFGSIFKDKKGKELPVNRSPIFWQRPLRSQKGSIGKCTLEPSKYRCPVSHPAFEEFRAWSFLNNIQYKLKGDANGQWNQLDMELREEIYREKFIHRMKSNFDFVEIYLLLKKKNGHDNWELNYHGKTNVAASPVSARLRDIFGDDWDNLKIDHAPNERRVGNQGTKTFYSTEDIWHVPFSCDDEEFVKSFASEKIGLNEEQTQGYYKLWESLPVDYANLSLKAIKNINYFLRKGLIYTEAALLAKIPEVMGNRWPENEVDLIANVSKVIEVNRHTKKRLGIVNNLIAQFKARPPQDKSAESSFDYVIDVEDKKQIIQECLDSYGSTSWSRMPSEEQIEIVDFISEQYQNFFNDEKRMFKKMPHLLDSMKLFLIEKFGLTTEEVRKLYHPSQVEIYPPAKRKYYEEHGRELLLLGSPKTGAFKNPMAMRALYEVRKLVNYLITTDQIDEQTRIVVELARELNDANKRSAIETYQNVRAKENQEFADAIRELVKEKGSIADANSNEDIDKFRLWYDMLQGDDAKFGSEKGKVFIENSIESRTKKGRKGIEEEYEVFAENKFENINKHIYFKLEQAGADVVKKYRLWKEQECMCMYTGKMINLHKLFQQGAIDLEHTLPRSKSFDNGLENLTVCYADYNRRVKKNQIPFNLPNYDHATTDGTAIKPRLEIWEKKVKDLELHIEFWKAKSKRATMKEDKDKAIRQKHLWQFELDYWKGKLSRFKMEEIKTGFKNSQLVDTQIISKYASHYLKTVFNKVEVQKGINTAVFRKIFGVQQLDEVKDRGKHSHHAKDAIVLSVIPVAALRELILKVWYEMHERRKLLEGSGVERENIQLEINSYDFQLKELLQQCNLPRINDAINRLDNEILVNNISRDQTLAPAKRKIRSRGRVVGILDEQGKPIYEKDKEGNPKQLFQNGRSVFKRDHQGELKLDDDGQPIPVLVPKAKFAQGDIIRGQLFMDTFYGKIRPAKWDEEGKPMKDQDGNFLYNEKNEGFRFVVRKEVNKDLNIESIVDPTLKKRITEQINGRTLDKTLKDDGGIWMVDRNGKKINKIRHIRCFADDVTNPLAVKRQTYLSSKEYKNDYWAKSGENYICALFQSTKRNKKGDVVIKEGREVKERDFDIYNLAEIATKKKSGESNDANLGIFRRDNRTGMDLIKEDGRKEMPYAFLRKGTKVIFYKESIEELKELQKNSPEMLNKRLYKVKKFAAAQLTLDFHLESRDDKELTKSFPVQGFFKRDEKGKEVTFGQRGKKGFTEDFFDCDTLNSGKPWHRLRYSKDYFDFAIEDKHFNVNPDGQIVWKVLND
ncbi:MAG: HNH endonuclease domain-containing protein [Flavobacteriales bacterium]|nr:HNH endonuclease domain-containing protein [Flavobacteriales bacterium]